MILIIGISWDHQIGQPTAHLYVKRESKAVRRDRPAYSELYICPLGTNKGEIRSLPRHISDDFARGSLRMSKRPNTVTQPSSCSPTPHLCPRNCSLLGVGYSYTDID